MKKVLLAVDHIGFSRYIEERLKSTHTIVGNLTYKDKLLKAIQETEPDILVIRETLSGKADILELMFQVASNYPDVRVIFIGKDRKPGDAFLTTLVSYKIYDILPQGRLKGEEVINLILNPNSYTDVVKYLPKAKYNEVDGSILFESPGITHEEVSVNVNFEGDVSEIDNLGKASKDEEINHDEGSISKNPLDTFFDKINFTSKNSDDDIEDEEVKEKPKKRNSIFGFNNKEKPIIGDANSGLNNSGQKIITFFGGQGGVGTTSIAVSTAMELASTGKKVIFIELNDIMPASSYWYDIKSIKFGIDTAIKALEEKRYFQIDQAIIKVEELKKIKGSSIPYKKFPDNIDFMYFSQDFISHTKNSMHMNGKDLFLYLSLQKLYDYVVIDAGSDIRNQLTIDALTYSHKVFTIITQDVASIGYQFFKIEKIEELGVAFSTKNEYIVNKYIKSSLTKKDIKNWLKVESLSVLQHQNEEFYDCNAIGLPLIYQDNMKLFTQGLVNKIFRS